MKRLSRNTVPIDFYFKKAVGKFRSDYFSFTSLIRRRKRMRKEDEKQRRKRRESDHTAYTRSF
jgi:hypothetical protein